LRRHTGDHEHEGRKIHVQQGSEAGHGPKENGASPEHAHEAGKAEAAQDVEAMKDELEKARSEAGELQDKYLRLYAETENFKKRMSRESAEREKYYNEGILKELLPVLDNLERAIAHADENGDSGSGLSEGVKMVKKQFIDALAKFGVKEVECLGLPFDPATQQAMMQVETADYDDNTVVEVFQKGYWLNDRILRPAMVTVAKRPASGTNEEPQGD
jgi:molecular chaperone GrpE